MEEGLTVPLQPALRSTAFGRRLSCVGPWTPLHVSMSGGANGLHSGLSELRRDEFSHHPAASAQVGRCGLLIPTYPPTPTQRGDAGVRFYRTAGNGKAVPLRECRQPKRGAGGDRPIGEPSNFPRCI